VVDASTLRLRVDLLTLIGSDTPLRRVAATAGGEYAGPCPFCGGRDRLRVQPERGLWWCRRCSDRWQDAIAYVMQRDGLTFPNACQALEDNPTDRPLQRLDGAVRRLQHEEPEPTAAWRAAAMVLVERCQATLWSESGERGRTWLQQRGLTDQTLRRWQIGYSAAAQEIAGLRVDRGIVIPWLAGGRLWHVNVRRARGAPKYRAVAGGHPFLFGVDTLRDHGAAVLTEGEFDTMLLDQEAGDLIGVATLGGCSRRLGPRAMRALLPLQRILVALDLDDAGEQGARGLLHLSARMRRVRVPIGIDLTESHQRGCSLRDWIAFNLARQLRQPGHDPVEFLTKADTETARDFLRWCGAPAGNGAFVSNAIGADVPQMNPRGSAAPDRRSQAIAKLEQLRDELAVRLVAEEERFALPTGPTDRAASEYCWRLDLLEYEASCELLWGLRGQLWDRDRVELARLARHWRDLEATRMAGLAS
jgi:DNA primase